MSKKKDSKKIISTAKERFADLPSIIDIKFDKETDRLYCKSQTTPPIEMIPAIVGTAAGFLIETMMNENDVPEDQKESIETAIFECIKDNISLNDDTIFFDADDDSETPS